MHWILFFVALCLPVSASASAIEKKSVEIDVSGGFSHQTFEEVDGHATNVQARVGILPALSNKIQLGGRLGLNHQSFDLGGLGEADGGALRADAVLRVNLGRSRNMIPFLELGAGVIVWTDEFGRDTNTITFPQLAVGSRMIVHDIASFNLSLGWVNEKNALGLNDFDADSFLLQFGFSVFPKGIDGTR
jgi:hypothetical protein